MYCSKCGQKATDDALYCKSCGAKIILNEEIIKLSKTKKLKRWLWVIAIIIILWLAIGALSATGVFDQDYEPIQTDGGIIRPPKLPSPPKPPEPPSLPKLPEPPSFYSE